MKRIKKVKKKNALETLVKGRPNACSIFATLLGTKYCIRPATLLRCVAISYNIPDHVGSNLKKDQIFHATFCICMMLYSLRSNFSCNILDLYDFILVGPRSHNIVSLELAY